MSDTDAALHVLAAVLRDPQGRVLLARRPEGKAHAGLWEFPGGKREAGESPLAALRRELHEELGIEAGEAEPLIRVPVAATPGASAPGPLALRLDTWQVAHFSGQPQAREHSALAWVALAELHTYPMPAADRPVVAALTRPSQLLIAPEPGPGTEAEARCIAGIEAALAGGLGRVHLRLRPGDPQRVERLALALAPRCREAGAGLWLHGLENAALALRAGLGLHLRAGELAAAAAPVAAARLHEQRAAGLPLSAACHERAELLRAEALGVDDALLGPVRATPSHPGQPGLGWAAFEACRACVPGLPVYALGGLAPADLAEARQHGAQGVAGIRGFWPG